MIFGRNSDDYDDDGERESPSDRVGRLAEDQLVNADSLRSSARVYAIVVAVLVTLSTIGGIVLCVYHKTVRVCQVVSGLHLACHPTIGHPFLIPGIAVIVTGVLFGSLTSLVTTWAHAYATGREIDAERLLHELHVAMSESSGGEHAAPPKSLR